MPRTREFDKQAVLEKAMLLFWEQGYEATSVRDLGAAMGLSSSSMYETFGDKRGVFLAALAHYCTIEQARIQAMAQASPTPHAFIDALFTSIDEAVLAKSRAQGSLTFNTMVEFGTRDPDVTAQLLDHYFKIVQIIADSISEAQTSGKVSVQTLSLHLAHTILAALGGLATLKGVKPDFAYREAVTSVILSLLDS
jgi:TetR/AcrR family transcriptional regulator, transcriptional repressor for nem operon